MGQDAPVRREGPAGVLNLTPQANTSMRLAGRVALVTGAAGGIGAAVARLFCAEGARVMLVDVNRDALQQTTQALRRAQPGAELASHVADISDEATAYAATDAAAAAFGGLDVLVNNAAVRNYSRLAEATA